MRLLFSAILVVALISTGCCGPMGCGVGCGIPGGCNDCDGASIGSNVIPAGPLENLRQMKRNLVCGGGCGEVYVGEWISTPPHAQDPCCGTEWVGGATRCQPFCRPPGTLIHGFFGALMGHRFCTGAESTAPCDCGGCEVGCGFVDSGTVIESGLDGGCATGTCGAGSCASGNCGSATVSTSGASSCGCASNARASSIRTAGRSTIMSTRAMDARVNQIRR